MSLPTIHQGNVQPGLDLEEHEGLLNAKRNFLVSAPTIFAQVNTAGSGNTTVEQGTDPWVVSNIGNITVEQGDDPWNTAVVGNVTLSDSKAGIGLVSIFGGQVDVGSALPAGDNNIGNVDIASSLPAGTNAIGKLAANSGVDIGDVDVTSNTAWSDPNTYLGLVTVDIGSQNSVSFSGNVTLDDGSKTGIVGNVTLEDSKTGIGLVSVFGGSLKLEANSGVDIGDVDVTSNTAWSDPNTYIGLVTIGHTPDVAQSGNWDVAIVRGNVTVEQGDDPWNVAVIGNVTLDDSKGYIGLVTTTYAPPPISTYTSFMTIYSATGNHTLFEPPSGERWVAKDIHIASLGRSELAIKSGDGYVIPFTALSTTGGYVHNLGEAGLAADGADEAFVIELNGAATISAMANVRFE